MKFRHVVLTGVAVIFGLPIVAISTIVATIRMLDDTNGGVITGGQMREHLLHVPASYDSARPTPLVISLHAGATWPAHQMNLTRWNRAADVNGFFVVYPSGTPEILGIVRTWRTFRVGPGLERDVRYISDLIDTLSSTYNIDPTRIYADGISNGGGMAYVLSCALSDRIAAVGVVAPAQSLPPSWCADKPPVPVIAFYGKADTLVPYDGGPLGDPFNPVKPIFPSAREFVEGWAMRNRCAAEPETSQVARDVTRTRYPGCADDAAVVLYSVEGGGHTWPGGKPMPEWRVGRTTTSIDATKEMWAFFREHPRLHDRTGFKRQ